MSAIAMYPMRQEAKIAASNVQGLRLLKAAFLNEKDSGCVQRFENTNWTPLDHLDPRLLW